jgi:MFS family permease
MLVMTAVLPSLIKDLALSPMQAGLLMSALTLPGLFAPILGGMAGDRFGTRWVVGLTAILAGLGSVLRGIHPTFMGIFLGTALVGLAQGFEWPNLVKTIAYWVDEKNRSLALGILISGYMISSALVMILTPLFVMPIIGGWAEVFVLYGVIATINGFAWLILVKNPESKKENQNGLHRLRIKDALKKLVPQKDLWSLGGMQFLGFLVENAFVSFMPVTLILLGIPEETAYLVASIQPWASTIGNFVGPALSDRIGFRKRFLVPRGIVNLIGFLLIASSNSLPTIILGILIIGFMGGITMPIMTTIPLEHPAIGLTLAGTATGLLGSLGSLGGTIGQITYGWLLETFGVRNGLIVMGFISLGITLFTLPLSETGRARILVDEKKITKD